MRFLYLFIALALVPILGNLLRSNPRHLPKVWFALGLLIWITGPYHLFFSLLPSWAGWPGYVKGLEISFIDVLSASLLLSGVGAGRRIAFKATFLCYFSIVVASIFISSFHTAAALYVWQLMRMALLSIAVSRSCEDPRAPKLILTGLVLGLLYNLFFAMVARIHGAVQSGGLIGHQNLFGLMSHMVAFPALALVLGGDRRKLLWLGPVGGLLTIIVAASRATFGLAIGAYLGLFIISALQGWSARKSMTSGLAFLSILVAIPFAIQSLSHRFEAEPIAGGYDERAAFIRAAQMMVADHPFGVGANQYVLVANTGGYSQRAGVVWNGGSRSANVHNVYWLFAAELGYVGALSFILLIVSGALTALRAGWGRPRDLDAQMLLGLGVAVVTVGLHSMFEWILVSFESQYLLALTFGMIGGISSVTARDQSKTRVRLKSRSPALATSET